MITHCCDARFVVVCQLTVLSGQAGRAGGCQVASAAEYGARRRREAGVGVSSAGWWTVWVTLLSPAAAAAVQLSCPH